MTRRCRRCGRAKTVGKGIGATGIPTCHACTARHKREEAVDYHLRAHPTQPCSRCGGPKPRGKGRRLCDTCLHPPRRCEGCGAEVPARHKVCAACKRARKRESSRRWNAAHPEKVAKARREWVERHPDRYQHAQRAWYERLKADPVAYADYLELRRMDHRLRAERDGRPLPPVPEHRYPAVATRWSLDPEPLRQLVLEYLAQDEGDNGDRVRPYTAETLGRAAGVSARLIYRLLHEPDKRISVVAADRLAVALGTHLDLLYEPVAA